MPAVPVKGLKGDQQMKIHLTGANFRASIIASLNSASAFCTSHMVNQNCATEKVNPIKALVLVRFS